MRIGGGSLTAAWPCSGLVQQLPRDRHTNPHFWANGETLLLSPAAAQVRSGRRVQRLVPEAAGGGRRWAREVIRLLRCVLVDLQTSVLIRRNRSVLHKVLAHNASPGSLFPGSCNFQTPSPRVWTISKGREGDQSRSHEFSFKFMVQEKDQDYQKGHKTSPGNPRN